MEILLHVLFLLGGGLLLYFGAEWMVLGAAGLAHRFGVTPLVVGLTVVAYGTSAPELAVSAVGEVQGKNIVLGTVIGSCIANLGLILGLTALIKPPGVAAIMIRREIPILVLSALSVPVVLYDGHLQWWESSVLLTASVAFTLLVLRSARTTVPSDAGEDEDTNIADKTDTWKKRTLFGLTALGIALLTGGGKLFVEGALGIATSVGLSEGAVASTIVAFGTSLPELAASVMAAARGYSGIAVGNVVGSNIFNVFLVLGAVGLMAPVEGAVFADGTGESLLVELGFLVGITVVGALAMRGKRTVSRAEGVLLLVSYAAFIGYTIANMN